MCVMHLVLGVWNGEAMQGMPRVLCSSASGVHILLPVHMDWMGELMPCQVSTPILPVAQVALPA